MESLESKKVRLLGRWLAKDEGYLETKEPMPFFIKKATSIITLLSEIENAFYNDSFEMSGERED